MPVTGISIMTPKDSNHVPVKEIILRFLEGTASEEEVSNLRTWLEQNETNRQYFDEVNNTFQASVTLNRLNHNKVESAWQKLSERIEESPALHASRTRHRYLAVLKIAASVCLLAVAGSLLFKIFP